MSIIKYNKKNPMVSLLVEHSSQCTWKPMEIIFGGRLEWSPFKTISLGKGRVQPTGRPRFSPGLKSSPSGPVKSPSSALEMVDSVTVQSHKSFPFRNFKNHSAVYLPAVEKLNTVLLPPNRRELPAANSPLFCICSLRSHQSIHQLSSTPKKNLKPLIGFKQSNQLKHLANQINGDIKQAWLELLYLINHQNEKNWHDLMA